jgi:hypothetical protein
MRRGELLAGAKLPARDCDSRNQTCVAPTALRIFSCDFSQAFRPGLSYAAPTALVRRD